jgi:hypothetical protein
MPATQAFVVAIAGIIFPAIAITKLTLNIMQIHVTVTVNLLFQTMIFRECGKYQLECLYMRQQNSWHHRRPTKSMLKMKIS